MKKLFLPLIGSALLLAACGGSPQPTPEKPATAKTKYQGVWGWGIGDPNTGELIDSGSVVFSEELESEGRTVAFGRYMNHTEMAFPETGKNGAALLGPVTEAGTLDAGFFLGTGTDARIFFIGQDDDNKLGLYQGKPAFEGTGNLATASNDPGQAVIVALIQVSDTVPATPAAQNTLNGQGKRMAIQALKTTFAAATPASARGNSGLFRAIASSSLSTAKRSQHRKHGPPQGHRPRFTMPVPYVGPCPVLASGP